MPHPHPVADLLSHLALAPRQAHKTLTLWPLVSRPDAPPSRAPAYAALADALDAGTLHVDELRGGAQVPHVAVENRGELAVLVLFGEELRGAMQNRIANASFLVGPHARVDIDVSCVEQGRWSRASAASRFAASRSLVSNHLRRKMAARVAVSRERLGRFVADQSEVWSEVERRVAGSGTRSATRAYADYASTRTRDLDEIAAAFRAVPRQVGCVAAVGDEVTGLEVVGRPEVFARVFAGLLRAYAIDAVDVALLREDLPRLGSDPIQRRFDAPEPFLAALGDTRPRVGPSLGLGEDVRLAGAGVCGCALVAGDVVHLTAFPAEGA